VGASNDVEQGQHRRDKRIRELVVASPLKNLWDLQGVPLREAGRRTWQAVLKDRLPSIAAELGFWFAFALFPALLCATTVMGLAARSATVIYDRLLEYLALVVPQSALGMVVHIFHETTAHSSSGKVTFGLLAAVWSASVGVSAIQDATNAVYKIAERRSYLKARLQAIALTFLVMFTLTLCLAAMFAGDFLSAWLHVHMQDALTSRAAVMATRILGWILAVVLLSISFSSIYYFAPDLRKRQWHWITPGAALGICGWLTASIGFRIYLHFFNTYAVTYGSLGVVIILLMWFYITGLMLLVGAEFNSEIEAAVAEIRLLRDEKTEAGTNLQGQPSVAPAA